MPTFLPSLIPEIPGYQFFSHSSPANDAEGAYSDFLTLPDKGVVVALGEVNAKGVKAALKVAKLARDTRICLFAARTLAAAVHAINESFCSELDEAFTTLSLSLLDPVAHNLTVCLAGHLPVLIRRSDGRFEEIGGEVAGFPLGVLLESTYSQVEVNLALGDVVIVYSACERDGRNWEPAFFDSHDKHRLVRCILESPGEPRVVGKTIAEAIAAFCAREADTDVTALICFARARGIHVRAIRVRHCRFGGAAGPAHRGNTCCARRVGTTGTAYHVTDRFRRWLCAKRKVPSSAAARPPDFTCTKIWG
jgi:serine phosphatase RsbU (regulator of sigma subunit)